MFVSKKRYEELEKKYEDLKRSVEEQKENMACRDNMLRKLVLMSIDTQVSIFKGLCTDSDGDYSPTDEDVLRDKISELKSDEDMLTFDKIRQECEPEETTLVDSDGVSCIFLGFTADGMRILVEYYGSSAVSRSERQIVNWRILGTKIG